jgi:predicted Zn-dependent peptidase
MQQWLRRPALTITLAPGQRAAYTEAKAVTPPKAGADKSQGAVKGNRALPPVGKLTDLQFPAITHTRLSNGIPVDYAQRTAVPVTQTALVFDAGDAADSPASRGLAVLTTRLLDEGPQGLSSQEYAEAQERLGSDINANNGADRSYVMLNALSPNLAPSLDLLADVVRKPGFRDDDIGRVKAQTLTGIAGIQKDPTKVARRVLPAVLYGANHPYGGPPGGDPKAIAAISRNDLIAFHQRWLRPDNLKIYVVSDRPLSEVQPLLEQRFASWTPPAVAKGVKNFAAPAPRPSSPKILLVNRPGAPQSSILGAQLLPLDPRGDIIPFDTANEVLGGNFLSRLNMDLRETKGWSYGVSGSESLMLHAVPYVVSAPVQADRTGDALQALNAQINEFLTSKGVTQEELTRSVANNINALPGEFETSGAVLGAMMNDDLLGRPDNYYETLPAKYRAQTTASLDQAARSTLDPKGFTWIVVGDAAKVRPQLEKLGIPIEVVEAP